MEIAIWQNVIFIARTVWEKVGLLEEGGCTRMLPIEATCMAKFVGANDRFNVILEISILV